MTKTEALQYILSCDEGDGPETYAEARAIYVAVFGAEPDEGDDQFALWSHACAAARIDEVENRQPYEPPYGYWEPSDRINEDEERTR